MVRSKPLHDEKIQLQKAQPLEEVGRKVQVSKQAVEVLQVRELLHNQL